MISSAISRRSSSASVRPERSGGHGTSRSNRVLTVGIGLGHLIAPMKVAELAIAPNTPPCILTILIA
jgi:hypothetical protein